MTLTFDPGGDDGSPRVFAGMWRPPTPDSPLGLQEWLRRTRRTWYSPEDVRRAWQDGAFDRPLYVLEEPS